jgi:trans-2,3-dihydro-3-hydroxyanthranilate isomerase
MDYSYHTLDVFTDRPFSGNPLAVFPEADGLSTEQMQAIARELNLSETVFVLPPTTVEGTRKVRIFTPGREVPFAGHPTVGTAFFLVASGAVEADGDEVTVVLEEQVGPVRVRVRCSDGVPVHAELTAAAPPREAPIIWNRETVGALVTLPEEAVGMPGQPLGAVGPDVAEDGRLTPAFASMGLAFLVLPVASVMAAESARLDSAVWSRLLNRDSDSQMVYLVAPGGRGEGVDFHVRMFGPSVGVPEDAATGSAAAALGAYLGRRLPDRDYAFTLEQGLEMGRPSRISLGLEVRDGIATRVTVGGSCVLMSSGSMRVG